jgi:hypothetical protein
VLRSISEAGARLLVTAALAPNDEVEIEFRTPISPKSFKVLAEVVRIKAVPGNVYCAAVRFQRRLSYAEFGRLT